MLWLIPWLTHYGLRGYLQIAKSILWADVDEALNLANIDDLLPGAVRAFLDLEAYGEQEVGHYDEDNLANYHGKFSQIEKSYYIERGTDDIFKEFAVFFANWVLL
jgi:hypothetical protein